jgi:hypothetical protein
MEVAKVEELRMSVDILEQLLSKEELQRSTVNKRLLRIRRRLNQLIHFKD